MAENCNPQPGALAGVRLGIFLNMPMQLIDGEYTSRYPHLFDFFLALGEVTAHTTLLVPLKHGGERNPDYGTVAIPPAVSIVGLPHWSSARMMVRRIAWVVPATLVTFVRHLRRVDAVGAVAPSVVGSILITLARLQRRPSFLLVRGEKQRTVRFIMGEKAARPYVAALRVMDALVRHWIKAGVPAFVAGHELVERYAAPRARLHDLYPALSRDFPLAERARPPRPADGQAPALVTVARLSGEKGIDDLLRAVAQLRDGGLPVRLQVVGEGPSRGELEALTAELGIGESVRFAGFVPHGPRMIAALDEGDLFVLPSRSEGLPHSVVEAMARALPVLATEVGGLPALLRGGVGVVVPVGDPAALAEAARAILTDREQLGRLSERSLETARRMHPDAQLTEFSALLTADYPQLGAGAGRDGHVALNG